MQGTIRGMGWLPDIPSIKDYTEIHPEVTALVRRTAATALTRRGAAPARGKGAGAAAAAAAAPATEVDLRAWFSEVEDQEQVGSCTANAAVGLLEYFVFRASGKHIDASRMFVYKTTRNLLGWTGDTGAYIRTAMQALVMFGAPPEAYWPYDGRPENTNARLDTEPTAFCYAFGSNFQAIKYMRLDPNGAAPAVVLENVKRYLGSGFPSMFGFPVYDEFMSVGADGLVPYPKATSRLYGGHAIVAAGYDDNLKIGGDKGALLIRNSWSTGWGVGGYAWMSYRYVTEGLAQDWWTLINAEWVDSGQFS